MRIAFIGQKGIAIGDNAPLETGSLTGQAGGIEQHVLALSRELAARGHDITVYSRRKYRMNHAEVPKGVRIRFAPTLYFKNVETILYTFFATIDALFRRFDIIHYHGVGPATLAWIPRVFKPGCRVVATFHSQDRFHQKWGWPARLYLHFGEWAACHFSHATIAVSHVIQVYVLRAYRRQVVYIPNGASVEQVTGHGELERFGLEPKKYVLNVGRLVPVKGQQHLVEAFQQLKARGEGKGIQLVLVGAPAYTKTFEERLRNLTAGNADIKLIGFQSGKTLKQLFTHAYVYVQPSEVEGLPIAVLEAMSFGVPVLVSDIPGNVEVIHHSGFTFHNKDVGDLSERLGELLRHPEIVEAAAEKAQEVIRTYFAWPVIAEHTEEVYRSIRH